jgi:mRNA interferase MazF
MLPEAGDIAWVELDPVKGTEQAGRRPALILSDATYHEASRRAVICPISRSAREWPFNVPLPSGLTITGSVMVDQIRAIERSERLFDFIERAPLEVMNSVRGRLAALLGIDLVGSITAPAPD